MPKCPKCKVEIDHLWRCQTGSELCEIRLGTRGVMTHSDPEFTADDDPADFDCPDCLETLFHDDGEARKFLAGK